MHDGMLCMTRVLRKAFPRRAPNGFPSSAGLASRLSLSEPLKSNQRKTVIALCVTRNGSETAAHNYPLTDGPVPDRFSGS